MGGVSSPSQSFMPEVKHRITSARVALNELRPGVFKNSALSLRLKLTLASSLIDSRWQYGSQTWPLLRDSELQQFT
eukprot:1263952-Lingulodinium_polyedra.AAC.1